MMTELDIWADAPLAPLHWTSLTTDVGRIHVAFRVLCPAFVSLDTRTAFEAFLHSRLGDTVVFVPRLPPVLRARVHATVDEGKPYKGPLDLGHQTDFSRQVLEVTRAIPLGETRTYGDIAIQIGHPRAARAVGTALSKNPVPLLIPCHRVIGAHERLGHYSDGGAPMKRRLLAHEGVAVDSLR